MTQMAVEIAEQPDAVRSTVDSLLPRADGLAELLNGRRRVLFAARGSSDNAAVYGRYLLEVHAGLPAALAAPSVATHYRARLDLSDTVVVSVSQSGATEEIVATQLWARQCGARTVAITNDGASPLAGQADLALVTQAGPERAVPATKSYTTQLAAMAVLGVAASPEPERLTAQLRRAPEAMARLLDEKSGLEDAVGVLAETSYTVVSGRGLLMGTALETALKLEETCLRPVRGYSYADLRHGPISVVQEGMAAVLVAAADGPLAAPMTELAGDLAARGATVIGLGGGEGFARACGVHLPGAELPEETAALASIVPAQLLVERLARRLGLDPDRPRGLAKITRTDT